MQFVSSYSSNPSKGIREPTGERKRNGGAKWLQCKLSVEQYEYFTRVLMNEQLGVGRSSVNQTHGSANIHEEKQTMTLFHRDDMKPKVEIEQLEQT
jgi:hypothetical protein